MNGNSNGNSTVIEELQWEVGLVNLAGKYLTAEQFGFKINASATSLRKKQRWVIEHGEEDVVYIRSHLGRYLSGDKKGNVTCCSETKGQQEQFIIEYCPKNSGRWAIRNRQTSYYFGGNEDFLQCYEKEPTSAEWWSAHLAVHPQINLRNVNRKTFARLENDSLVCSETIPWGCDSLITIEWKGNEKEAKYAVKSADNRYLQNNGELSQNSSLATFYRIELRSGQNGGLAFKDKDGKYLTAVGKGKIQAKNKTISRDELFVLQDSHPQGVVAAHNGKNVSIRQGVSLSANQERTEDEETHQIEFDKASGGWFFRAGNGKLWTVVAAGIEATANKRSIETLFDLEYFSDGWMAVKARVNDKYLTARGTGSLSASSPYKDGETERFLFTMINRPIIVLRTEYGFMGCKTVNNPKIECNKTSYDTLYLEMVNGEYFIKAMTNGEYYYWAVATDNSVNADSNEPYPFYLEHSSQSKFVIRTPENVYLKCEQNGTVTAKASRQNATQIEY